MEHILRIGPLHDPIERQQAPMLQRIFVAFGITAAIALAVFWLSLGTTPGGIVLMGGAALVALSGAAGIIALSNGRFQLAVLLASFGVVLAVLIVAMIYSYPAATSFLIVTLVPVLLTGLAANTRILITVASASGLISILTLALKPVMAPITAAVVPASDLSLITIAVFLLVIVVIVIMLALFGPALRQALRAALAREQELEHLRNSLETTVAERTKSLQEALEAIKQRETQLQRTLDELRTSQDIIRELSAPVIPILPGVLIAPLVGSIDSARARMFTTNVLRMIEQQRARHIIFDITGVPVVDTQVAGILIRTASATRLVGAQVIVVGIRPEVAQTLVGLDVTLDQLTTYADLQQAIAILLQTSERKQL